MKSEVCCNMYCKCMIIYVVVSCKMLFFIYKDSKLKSILLMAPADNLNPITKYYVRINNFHSLCYYCYITIREATFCQNSRRLGKTFTSTANTIS